MNNHSMNEVLKKIAVKEGVSVEYVRKEIQEAIDAGMASPNEEIQARWKEIEFKGSRPTPEEVIYYLTKQAKR